MSTLAGTDVKEKLYSQIRTIADSTVFHYITPQFYPQYQVSKTSQSYQYVPVTELPAGFTITQNFHQELPYRALVLKTNSPIISYQETTQNNALFPIESTSFYHYIPLAYSQPINQYPQAFLQQPPLAQTPQIYQQQHRELIRPRPSVFLEQQPPQATQYYQQYNLGISYPSSPQSYSQYHSETEFSRQKPHIETPAGWTTSLLVGNEEASFSYPQNLVRNNYGRPTIQFHIQPQEYIQGPIVHSPQSYSPYSNMIQYTQQTETNPPITQNQHFTDEANRELKIPNHLPVNRRLFPSPSTSPQISSSNNSVSQSGSTKFII